MRIIGLMGSVEAIRRKLRAVTAVAKDSGATEHEKANAEALKTRLEQRLRDVPIFLSGSPMWATMAGSAGDGNRVDAQAFIDQKPHYNGTGPSATSRKVRS
jgi:hypothetical protein